VAFLTLGDPLTYSTYGYILRNIQVLAPQLDVITIPGITSFQAAAARLNRPLVEGEESLLVTSGAFGGNSLRRLAEKLENIVFLKAYRNVRDITTALKEADMLENSVALSKCSREDEEIIEDIMDLCDRKPDYWTLIMAKNKKH
jgi:precorrin-2/cobalt-factor-2 C20-methyltransferase